VPHFERGHFLIFKKKHFILKSPSPHFEKAHNFEKPLRHVEKSSHNEKALPHVEKALPHVEKSPPHI